MRGRDVGIFEGEGEERWRESKPGGVGGVFGEVRNVSRPFYLILIGFVSFLSSLIYSFFLF